MLNIIFDLLLLGFVSLLPDSKQERAKMAEHFILLDDSRNPPRDHASSNSSFPNEQLYDWIDHDIEAILEDAYDDYDGFDEFD